jgi:hypothetical protein
LETLFEASCKILQVEGVLIALCTSKNRHLATCSSKSKLHLSITDLHEVLASLNEGIDFSENGLIFLEVPSFTASGVDLDHAHLVFGDDFPFLTACDTLVKIGHALLNVSAEHVFNLDLSLASADNLVADLGHETAHSLRITVGAAQFKNHAHTVEDLRH